MLDQLNNFGLGIVLAVSGFFIYGFGKFSNWLIIYITKAVEDKRTDDLAEKIMKKYTPIVRQEAKSIAEESLGKLKKSLDDIIYIMRQDIKEIKDSMKTEKERNHDAIAKNEGVLNKVLETALELDKKLNEKTIINIPTSKRNGSSEA